MKILYGTVWPTFPITLGGGQVADRSLLEGLAASGHTVRAVSAADERPPARPRALWVDDLLRRGATVEAHAQADRFTLGGVDHHSVHGQASVGGYFRDQLASFAPDWVVVSIDGWLDPPLLATAVAARPDRVIYLAHSTAQLPFGPDAAAPSAEKTALLRRVARVVACSRFMVSYIRAWSRIDATLFYYPAYGTRPHPRRGGIDKEFVVLVNPAVIKGLPILLALAQALPEVQFAVVESWAASEKDREGLARAPNITQLPLSAEIDHILDRARVVLCPSLGREAFGLVVVESLLRGIPVLASQIGGIPEAMAGAPELLPVRPIVRHERRPEASRIADRLVPVVPAQDIEPWRDALTRLLSDRALYEARAEISRRCASAFVAPLGIEPFERILGG
jgi:glycosyltransferase involved in cell wall biosynthesis